LVKKTPEEIADGNARTNEVGLFNYADSYLCCAKHLNTSPSLHLRFDAPIHFLLFHAAELYLKSYLRQKGEDLEAVKRLGHFHPQMCAKAAAFGMNLPAEIQEIFELADQTDAVIESRYLRTGPKQRIETKALLAAVEEVRAKVKVQPRGGRSHTRRHASSALMKDQSRWLRGFELRRMLLTATRCKRPARAKKCTLLRPLRTLMC
jgi:hypothetical protein